MTVTSSHTAQMSAEQLYRMSHNPAVSDELGRRLMAISLAVSPVAAEYTTDHELTPTETRAILDRVINILENTHNEH